MRASFMCAAWVAMLSGCAAEAGGEVLVRGEELSVEGGGIDGTPCCANDYRGGNGEPELCGHREGGWCCTDDRISCAACWYYECEPPPAPAPTRPRVVAPIGPIVRSP